MALRLHERVLDLQVAIDRFIRRLRRGGAPAVTQRRFLIVQIDGLSRAVLDKALASGHMRFVKQLLRRHGYRVQPMSVGLPTSTPAFQMAAMYGVRPDIPGFHYYDRDRQADVHFPRRGHAAMVEAKLSASRRGILQGGSAYGCVFTGGADNNLFTFASLTNPSGRGVLAALSPFVVLGWVCMRSLMRTVVELLKALPHLLDGRTRQQGRRWFAIKVGISVWLRGLFTMAVCRDLYAGVPAIYVNYLDYDEAAHAFGPHSRPARVTLRRIDRAIHQLWRVMRRVSEHRHDLYILADHGQTSCKPYRQINAGERFERWIFDQLLTQTSLAAELDTNGERGLIEGIRSRSRGVSGFFQQFINYIDQDFIRHRDPEAHEQDGIRVISAGPNAFLYVLDGKQPHDIDALERRFPGLALKLSQSPGVGLVLARSVNGPVCFCQGKRYDVGEYSVGPFAGRADGRGGHTGHYGPDDDAERRRSRDYGTGAAEGHVSFIAEMGSHAGPSAEELHTFIVHPASITLPAPIVHPVQLYAHFMHYQEPAENVSSFSGEEIDQRRCDESSRQLS